MSISLKPEHEQFIQSQIEKGKYANADEVISEAFRLLEERERQYEQWFEETRKKVAIGIKQLDQGEGLDGEVVVAQLQEKFRKAREAQE